jgi:hypothetical protein
MNEKGMKWGLCNGSSLRVDASYKKGQVLKAIY